MSCESAPETGGAAFMLAQLGFHAAERFGERMRALGLNRPHAGILRLVASMPDCSQRSLADRLGILPSRIVALIDELEAMELVRRERSSTDRRNYRLVLTLKGQQVWQQVSELASAHEEEICAPLDADERKIFGRICHKLVLAHGLLPGVHPGFRRL
jgi:DNA-binding MarR family transcriptional regulator